MSTVAAHTPELRRSAAQRVLLARWCIARAGESDGLNWWRSEALGSAGQSVLSKLTPRIREWSGVKVAVEAAKLRHSGMLSKIGGWHLFDLGDTVEAMLETDPDWEWNLWNKYRGALKEPFTEPTQLCNFLMNSVGIDKSYFQAALKRTPVSGRVEVSALTASALAGEAMLTQAVAELAAAYVLGDRHQLVVPYIRPQD